MVLAQQEKNKDMHEFDWDYNIYKRTKLEVNPIKIVRECDVFDREALEKQKKKVLMLLLI